jgi:hypothetical protein
MAAMTMLGKTVEVCFVPLTETCQPSAMTELREELTQLNDPEFAYDVSYVSDCIGAALGWGPQPPPGTKVKPAPPAQPQYAAPPAPRVGGGVAVAGPQLFCLEPVWTQTCRPGSIYTLALDAARSQVVCSVSQPNGHDVAQVWAESGFCGEFSLGSNMVTQLDIVHPGLMLAASMPKPHSDEPSSVRFYTTSNAAEQPSGWAAGGVLARPDAKPLVGLRWLPPSGSAFTFVLGETNKGAPEGCREQVSLFQLNPSTSFASLVPLETFTGHTDIITALEVYPEQPKCLLSASKDRTIRLWDRDAPRQAGIVLALTQEGVSHSVCVKALSARGHELCSAAIDGVLTHWDLRLTGRGPARTTPPVASWSVDGSPLVTVALGAPGAGCVASTIGVDTPHIFQLDTSGGHAASRGQPPAPQLVTAFGDRPATGTYHALKWDATTGMLYGGHSVTRDGLTPARLDGWRPVPLRA